MKTFFWDTSIPGFGQYRESYKTGLNMESETDIGKGPDESEQNDNDKDKDKDRKGTIIELRKLGADVPGNKLKEFALAVFDLTWVINNPHSKPPASQKDNKSEDEVFESNYFKWSL